MRRTIVIVTALRFITLIETNAVKTKDNSNVPSAGRDMN